ncbi:MAG: VanZ family protein [Culicoidibacterales bacterium]
MSTLLIILILLLLLWQGFISFNSLQVGQQSEARSRSFNNKLTRFKTKTPNWSKIMITWVLSRLHVIFDPLYPTLKAQNNAEFEHFLIRKAAHMTQFFVLTILWLCLFTSINLIWYHSLFYSLALVLLASVIDEFIQHFVPNRSASVIDVLVDFSGGLIAGIGYFILVISTY